MENDSRSISTTLNMLLKNLLFSCLVLISSFSFAQTETVRLSLEEVIALAQSDAPDVLLAQTCLQNNYWVYQSFLADYKPQIDLNAQVPSFNQSIVSTTQPESDTNYVPTAFMTNSVGILLSQNVALTGG